MKNKKKVVIVCAGQFAFEVLTWLRLEPDFFDNYEIIGAVDDTKPDGLLDDIPVLCKIADFEFTKEHYAIIAITDCNAKEMLYEKYIKGRCNLFTFVSSKTLFGKNVVIGDGAIICPNTIISNSTVIGDLVTINISSNIGHDCNIASFSSLMVSVTLGGHCNIGKSVFMGSNSVIIPQKNVGDFIKIGAGAVIYNDLKVEGTYIGNPAKKMF